MAQPVFYSPPNPPRGLWVKRLTRSVMLLLCCLLCLPPCSLHAAPSQQKEEKISTSAPRKNKSVSASPKSDSRKKTVRAKKNASPRSKKIQNRPQIKKTSDQKKRKTSSGKASPKRTPPKHSQIKQAKKSQSATEHTRQHNRLNTSRTVQAMLMRDNDWLLPQQSRQNAFSILESLQPYFVLGALQLTPNKQVTPDTVKTWQTLRHSLRKGNSDVSFDLSIDLRRYNSPEAVKKHMREMGQLLQAEAWTFEGASTSYEAQPAVFLAALAEAKAQKRFVGGVILGNAIPPNLDYLLVSSGSQGEALQANIPTLNKMKSTPGGRRPSIIGLSGIGRIPGEGFVFGKAPSTRRRLVLKSAQKQGSGVSFAYPVFGPLSMNDRAYDASRDEFMLDTIKRCLRLHNSPQTGTILSLP